jgi:hypothetical protein
MRRRQTSGNALGRWSRPSRWIAAAILSVLATAGVHAPVAGAVASNVVFSASINGQSAALSSDAHPAQLYPNKPAIVRITVSNHSASTQQVATVRVEGTVLDLPLFSYDTAVNLVVPPGRTKSLSFPLQLTSVGSQATGLVVGSVTLLQPNGTAIESQALVTNIHGSFASLYGLFGLVVLILTVFSLATGLLALVRHTLPQNRWLRGVRFLVPGFGVGLVLTFTLSAFHVFTPGPGHWLPLLIVPTATGLALGFLTPAPDEEEFDDYDDDVLLAQIVVVDEDPLDAEGLGLTSAGVAAARAPSAVPDSRPTGAPSAVPDSRPTGAPSAVPDSRPTGAPSAVPDSRPTGPAPALPDSRPTIEPD